MMTRSIVALLTLCCALGAQASPLPDYPFVATSGSAQIWLRPDIAELQFETGAQHASAQEAANAIDALGNTVLQMLAEHGVAEADIESYEISKKTVELSKPSADGDIQAYSLGRHFRVQVRDLEQWPQIIAALLALDHVDTIGASFDRSDRDRVNTQLMTEAANDARANGGLLAASFGRKLGPAVAIARGALDKVGAPFLEQRDNAPRRPARPQTNSYAVPTSIAFSQAVNAIFKLK